ncbi:MAG: 50S ribosomal protein L11 methyltransferase [Deltaproteobacteria bacterium]|nr:50S ribosomal protein L11 methyltransferase [Deltaproteobacteria bacterium]
MARAKTTSAPQPASRSAWLEAAVRVPLDAAEQVGRLLVEAGSQGVITGVRELARGARRRTHETVRGFFPSREPVRARLAVRAALGRAREVGVRRAAVRWRELDASLWEMDWRRHFQPVRAGRRLVVVPPWDREDHGGRTRVVIHPGMAFGTGQHATTLGCLEALERLARPAPSRALDVGTGTGVLAIALAKLGVPEVVALDLDPQAIAAARGNLRRNAIRGRVRLACRDLAGAVPAPPAGRGFPLVVANLYVDALVALAPTIMARVAPGGRLVTSGVLRSQQARVRAAYAAPAWRLRSAQRRGAWVTSVFERRAPTDAGTIRARSR